MDANREHENNELKELAEKYIEIEKRMKGPSLVQNLLNQIDQPCTKRVMTISLSQKFKVSRMEMYDGSKDLIDHLDNFKTQIMLHNFEGEIAY